MPRSRNPIIEALDQVYGDTSVSRAVTHARLSEAQEHLDMLLGTLSDEESDADTETGYDA